ncbi:hypothetical protein D3C71_1325650 [compost metagenome]
MSFPKNMSVTYFCWTCKKEHVLTEDIAGSLGVKCDSCDGYIITPSGRVQVHMRPVVSVFLFNDGEKHWIAAKTLEEAERCFNAEYNEDRNKYTLEEIPYEQYHVCNIRDKDASSGKEITTSLLLCIQQADSFPALLASTVY